MPKGDYGSGSKLVQLHIEIDVSDEYGRVKYCGCGYHVELPSGKRHPSALSIELGQQPELKADLDSIAEKVATLVREHEGVGR